MLLPTKIKASSITHLTDARYFAAWHVEWMGFQLEPGQDHFIDPTALAAIREWIDGPRITGEFYTSTAEEIRAAVRAHALDAVQVGPFAQPETLVDIAAAAPVLQEYVVDPSASPEAITDFLQSRQGLVEAVLLNFSKGGLTYRDLEAAAVQAVHLEEWCANYPILIDMDFRPRSASEALDLFHPYGFAVQGGDEEKVGFKSFDQLDGFFESLENVAS